MSTALLPLLQQTGGALLEPIVRPTLNRLAEAPCRSMQAAGRHEVESLARLLTEDERDFVVNSSGSNYVVTMTRKNGRVSVTETGTGPMKGDLITATEDGLVRPKRDFCAGTKFPRGQ